MVAIVMNVSIVVMTMMTMMTMTKIVPVMIILHRLRPFLSFVHNCVPTILPFYQCFFQPNVPDSCRQEIAEALA
jgi:hypothetical protein